MPPRDDEVQTLVEQLSAELERSVLVDDASLRLISYSPTLGSDDEVRRTAILTRETPRVIRDLHFAQGIASATSPVRTASRPDFGLESRVCVPIRRQELEKPRREQERRLLEALLTGEAAARDEAAHELLAADLIVGGTPIGALCMRPW